MESEVILDRRFVQIKDKQYVQHNNDIYKISQFIDFNEIIGVDIKTNRAKKLLISSIKPIELDSEQKTLNSQRDLIDISDNDWKIIEERFQAIKPILYSSSRRDIEKHAKKINIHFSTLYRWLKKYHSSGAITGLLPEKTGRTKGEIRIDSRAESIIQEVIEKFYLTKQRPSAQKTINQVNIVCKQRGVAIPSKNTIRNRINQLTEYERLSKQGDRSIARTKFDPAPNSLEARFPLEIVQIDHTQVDIMIVDDETRKSIGRPWITLAIDIYSRMIHGYYLSLEPPSTTSVAMCLSNAILPKDSLLIEKGIDSEWNIWGAMHTIHVDNGADFRSDALRKACLNYDIHLEFRPVGRPNFGGHIERLIGTIMKEVHSLPGTTSSNIAQRRSYDSEGNACMTFGEFEKWLLTTIVKVYHKRKHHTIGMSPEAKWNEGIFGTFTHEGIGYPPKPSNELTVLIDFLPYFERTIQKNGVNIDGLNYYDHVLRPLIRAVDKDTNKNKKFIFKRDPRDISYIWYYDDISAVYRKIPLANQSIPSMSLWEYNASKNLLKSQGRQYKSPHDLIDAHEELYQQVQESVKKTKKVRRQEQRKKEAKKQIIKEIEKTDYLACPVENIIQKDDDLWDDDVPIFD